MALHTLTVGREPLCKRTYKRIKSRLYELFQKGYVSILRRTNPPFYHITTFPGILVKLCRNHDAVRRFELKINPARMFGGDYSGLYELTSMDCTQLITQVDNLLEIIEADFSFEDMCLTRIDCTQDITLPETLQSTELIGAIQRTKLGYGYDREEFGRSYKNYAEKNRHSFRAKCYDISLTIYDKSFQLNEERIMQPESIPPRLLRFEAAFDRAAFRRVLNEHLEGTYIDLSAGQTILSFSKLSLQLLKKYFGLGVMPGRFMRLDIAMREIEKSSYTPAIKRRMQQFMIDVRRQYRHGVEGVLAYGNLSAGESSYLLKCFRDLDLNPAALPMNCKCEQFPSITQLLKGEEPA